MVITNLQEKENKKFYVPIRGGNRGGWSLFKWDTVRQMPYKQRQLYLGSSSVIGVLDKGGKWRKKDWYLKGDKKHLIKDGPTGMQQAMKRDQQRMNQALGISTQQKDQQALTEQQMKQLLKRIKNKGQQEQYIGNQHGQKMIGLGFDKTKVEIRAKPALMKENPYRLQEINQEELPLDQPDQKCKKPMKRSSSEENNKERDYDYHKEKKIKKEKKQKKHKQHKQKKQHKQHKQHKHKDKHKKHRKDSRSHSKDRKHKQKRRRVQSSDSQ